MKTYVSPNSFCRSLSRLRIWACTDTSSAETGSSQTISDRVDRERAGDADPLALAAGELVREPVVVLRVEPDDLEQLRDAALALGRRADAVDVERLGDDEADALARVERRVRVLEDHHHLAPERAHVLARELRDVPALEDDLAVRRLEQLHDAARHRRLAAAGLADDAERLALPEGEADPVDGLHGADLLLEDDPAGDREVLLQVLDDQDLVSHQWLASASTVALQPRGLARLRLVVEEACLRVIRLAGHGLSSGSFCVQMSITYAQRGLKRQPGGGLRQRRRLARDLRQPLDVRVEPRQRAEQAPRVRVLRVLEDRVDRAVLDDLRGVHHDDVVGRLGDDAEVVRDQHDRRAVIVLELLHHVTRICACVVTSSAVVGSSAIRSLGSLIIAIAIITRCRMPPENWCG